MSKKYRSISMAEVKAKRTRAQRVKVKQAQDELEDQLIRQSQLADELGMSQGELSFMSVRALDHVFSLRGTEWRRQLTIAYRKEMISILAGQLVSG